MPLIHLKFRITYISLNKVLLSASQSQDIETIFYIINCNSEYSVNLLTPKRYKYLTPYKTKPAKKSKCYLLILFLL